MYPNDLDVFKQNTSSTDARLELGSAEIFALSFYIGVVGVLGVLGNVLVVAAFYRYRSLRTSTNTFILHLGLCNLILASMDLLFTLPSTASKKWMFGLLACRFYGLTYHFFCYVSLNTLAIISLDRYWVITKPAIGIKITIKRALICIAVSYVYTLVFSIPLFLQWESFEEKIFYTGCYLTTTRLTVKSLLYSIVHGVFLFLFPFGLMIFCYGSIFKSVKRKGRYGVRLRSKKNKWIFAIQRIPHWRTARMIIVVIFVFLACWLPYVIVSTCMSLGRRPQISLLTLEITLLVAKSGVIYNPFIYAALNLRFRTAFFEMLRCDKFLDRAKWGIKSRVLTATTFDSSGQFVSRTSASNCVASSRALVTRSEAFERVDPEVCGNIEVDTEPSIARPHSAPVGGSWIKCDSEIDDCVCLPKDEPWDSNLEKTGAKLLSMKSCTDDDSFSNSNSNSDKSEQSLVNTQQIITKGIVLKPTSSSSQVIDDKCPCKEIWETRNTSKYRRKKFSGSGKDESTFSCTCGPNVVQRGTLLQKKRKEKYIQQTENREITNGNPPIAGLEICPNCTKLIKKEYCTKMSGFCDQESCLHDQRFLRDCKKNKRERRYNLGRRSLNTLEIRQSKDSLYCACVDRADIKGILERKLTSRRTSDGVHSGMMVMSRDSFWRRPSLVLANNVYPITLTPSQEL
uniref:Opsin n=2 Tax=Nematostella vectensis TaxID=45351 RepID=A9UMY4_NEMVE|nr:TPA: opsin [Nematostella vectensis]